MTQIAVMVAFGLAIELFFVCDVMVQRHRRRID
jgi:hypothetical protein